MFNKAHDPDNISGRTIEYWSELFTLPAVFLGTGVPLKDFHTFENTSLIFSK